VDLQERVLCKNGRVVKLQDQPFRLLEILLERPGEIVSISELTERIWPKGTIVDFEHSLYTGILKIRRALGDLAENPRFIETIPRHGYRFIAPIEIKNRFREQTCIQYVGHKNYRLTSRYSRGIWKQRLPPWLNWWTAALFTFIATILFLIVYTFQYNIDQKTRSIAVLPFRSNISDMESDYLQEAIPACISANLSQLDGLRVVSSDCLLQYKDQPVAPEKVSSKFGIQALVTGTLFFHDDMLSVNVQLTECGERRILWGAEFAEEYTDLFDLQKRISKKIAGQLRQQLKEPEQSPELMESTKISDLGNH
jgi:DNA-binding winged helix-turn-helix (wHTH) protein/TolB-like protein